MEKLGFIYQDAGCVFWKFKRYLFAVWDQHVWMLTQTSPGSNPLCTKSRVHGWLNQNDALALLSVVVRHG
jgi:hypothetical protein